MMLNLIAFIVGLCSLGFGIYFEISWRRKIANWYRTFGNVVDVEWATDGASHRIGFNYEGKSIEFVSPDKHNWEMPVGRKVEVLYDPVSGSARLLNWRTRWSGTLSTFFVGTLFLYGSIFG